MTKPPAPLRLSAMLVIAVGGLQAASFAQPLPSIQAMREALLEGRAGSVIEALTSVPDSLLSPEQAYVLGKAYQMNLQSDRAIFALRRSDTTRAAVQYELSVAYERNGALQLAADTAERAFRADSTNRVAAMQLVRVSGALDRWEEAARVLRSLVRDRPDDSTLRAQLAQAYERMDSTFLAIVNYERAVAIDAGNVRAALALVGLYLDRDYWRSARGTIDRALDARPDHTALLRRSAEIALHEAEYERANLEFRKARGLGDRGVSTLRGIGVSAYLLDSVDVALPLLQRAWESDSSEAMSALYLGMAYARKEHIDEARRLLEYAGRLGGKQFVADVYVRLGSIDQTGNDPKAALAAFKTAYELDPERVDVLFYRAAVHDATDGDAEAALELYGSFLATEGHLRYPEMAEIARRRVRQIRETRFLEQGRRQRADSDSATVATDRVGTGPTLPSRRDN